METGRKKFCNVLQIWVTVWVGNFAAMRKKLQGLQGCKVWFNHDISTLLTCSYTVRLEVTPEYMQTHSAHISLDSKARFSTISDLLST